MDNNSKVLKLLNEIVIKEGTIKSIVEYLNTLDEVKNKLIKRVVYKLLTFPNTFN